MEGVVLSAYGAAGGRDPSMVTPLMVSVLIVCCGFWGPWIYFPLFFYLPSISVNENHQSTE